MAFRDSEICFSWKNTEIEQESATMAQKSIYSPKTKTINKTKVRFRALQMFTVFYCIFLKTFLN